MKASKALSASFLVSAIQISWRARFAFECWLLGSLLSTLAVLCTGDLTLAVDASGDNPRRTWKTDTEMQMAAAGADGAGRLAESESQTSRLRFILEGSHRIEMAGGQALTPSLEVGLRHDGGDAETGTGIELGAGVSYADPALGLTVEGKARGLLAHEDTD